jgi:hypothetical protein
MNDLVDNLETLTVNGEANEQSEMEFQVPEDCKSEVAPKQTKAKLTSEQKKER